LQYPLDFTCRSTYYLLIDRRYAELCCSYILNNPTIVFDLLADIPPLHLANSLAVAALTGTCNGRQLAQVVSSAVFPNDTLADVIQQELVIRYRTWSRFQEVEA
jgi:hypothetical protein